MKASRASLLKGSWEVRAGVDATIDVAVKAAVDAAVEAVVDVVLRIVSVVFVYREFARQFNKYPDTHKP